MFKGYISAEKHRVGWGSCCGELSCSNIVGYGYAASKFTKLLYDQTYLLNIIFVNVVGGGVQIPKDVIMRDVEIIADLHNHLTNTLRRYRSTWCTISPEVKG